MNVLLLLLLLAGCATLPEPMGSTIEVVNRSLDPLVLKQRGITLVTVYPGQSACAEFSPDRGELFLVTMARKPVIRQPHSVNLNDAEGWRWELRTTPSHLDPFVPAERC